MQSLFHSDNGNTVRIFTLKITRLDGLLNFLKAIDRGMAIQFARNHYVSTIRGNIYPVRTFWLWDKIQNPFLDCRVNGDDIVTIIFNSLPFLHDLCGFTPINHMKKVSIFSRATGFKWWLTTHNAAHIAF